MSHQAQPLPRPDLPDYDRFAKFLVAVDRCSTRTGKTYAQRCRLAVDWFTVNRPGTPLLELTPEDIEDYIIDLYDRGLSSSSRSLAVFALRKLYSYLGRQRPGGAINPARQVNAPPQHSRRPDPWTSDELAR
ncbi:MAG: site-specific integrase, partial [Nitriliruptor sp.]|uniref:site-specific integrase n=1 Tax=Nitriliruptor sp. TaxID=2448056 RepID=UPI0034A049BE